MSGSGRCVEEPLLTLVEPWEVERRGRGRLGKAAMLLDLWLLLTECSESSSGMPRIGEHCAALS